MGRHNQLSNSGQKQKLSESNCHTLKGRSSNIHNYCSKGDSRSQYHSWRLFPQQESESFTNRTSTVALQLLNPWLLKTMLMGKKDGVMIINKTRTSDDWKWVIWSDELSFKLFPTSGWVCVWIMSKEAHNPECMVPTVKHGVGSVMIWAANIWVFCWFYNYSEWLFYCR